MEDEPPEESPRECGHCENGGERGGAVAEHPSHTCVIAIVECKQHQSNQEHNSRDDSERDSPRLAFSLRIVNFAHGASPDSVLVAALFGLIGL